MMYSYPPYPTDNGIIPGQAEKKRIRKLYNSTGLALILQYALTYAIVIIAVLIMGDLISEEYNEEGSRIVGFAEAALMFCAPAASSIITFFIYSAWHRISIPKLFSTEKLTAGYIGKSTLITLLFYQAGMLLMLITFAIVTTLGYSIPSLDYELDNDIRTTVMDVFTSIILAPIAEELFFRGIVLKQLSKVSLRFGIIMSAILFGLMHGNIFQFVMATTVGIAFAYADAKADSLIPSLIGHMAVNLTASIPQLIELNFSEELASGVSFIIAAIQVVLGAVMLLYVIRRSRITLPSYTEYHKQRTLPIIITSAAMIIITVIYLYDLFSCLEKVDTEQLGEITEAAAGFIL